MKYLIALILSVITLSVYAVEPPSHLTAMVSLLNGNPETQIIVVAWQPAVGAAPDSYEVQRKLFPWGWRNVGTAKTSVHVWWDRKPSKRVATYRVRAVDDGQRSKWSKPVKCLGVSQ